MEFVAKQPDETVNVSPTHPLKELATILIGIAVVVTVVFLLVALLIELAVPLIPPEVEARVFSGWGDLASEVAGVRPRSDAELQQLLRHLGRHWADNPYQLTAAVIDCDEVNAMALPGGAVMVTRGLLDAVGNEQELAFVLAHELGHFANRDHLRRLGRGTTLGLLLATLTGGGAPKGAVDLVSHLQQAANTGFDRRQELAADRFGVEVIIAEYGNATGAVSFFGRLREVAASEGPVTWLPYLRTHPSESDRLQQVRQMAAPPQ